MGCPERGGKGELLLIWYGLVPLPFSRGEVFMLVLLDWLGPPAAHQQPWGVSDPTVQLSPEEPGVGSGLVFRGKRPDHCVCLRCHVF